jgi:hypothetical protein
MRPFVAAALNVGMHVDGVIAHVRFDIVRSVVCHVGCATVIVFSARSIFATAYPLIDDCDGERAAQFIASTQSPSPLCGAPSGPAIGFALFA